MPREGDAAPGRRQPPRLSPKAVELVDLRLRDKAALFHKEFVTTRTDIPRRTDIDAPIPYRQNKHVLYGQQEGRCGGCDTHFEFRHFEVDHIVPRSRGGGTTSRTCNCCAATATA
ncbi:MAG: HNH endonuclease [Acidimicrobiia bacterium]|nr:HNH endonuclease [Acidimicrobiia bacterium]